MLTSGFPLGFFTALSLGALGCGSSAPAASPGGRSEGGAVSVGGATSEGGAVSVGGATNVRTGQGGSVVGNSSGGALGSGGSINASGGIAATGGAGAVAGNPSGGALATGGAQTKPPLMGGANNQGGTTLGCSTACGGKVPRGGAETGGTGTGGAAFSGAAGAIECPKTGGPSMVQLPEGYCIDSTEVTRAQYAAWLSASPSTDGQIAICTWNTTFVPDAACLGSESNPTYACLTNCDNHPQVCVDWCDATAYCRAMGKRLCGKIGGGSNGASLSLSESQWYNACASHDAANRYPYGADYDPKACNGWDLWYPTTFVTPPYEYLTTPGGSLSTCQSSVPGYQGVFDLSGNVAEWEDSCSSESGSSPLAVGCYTRGGSFSVNTSLLRCNSETLTQRLVADVNIGFRCCSDP
jgi:formylglycine-generating enzyme